jgi:hypothetical protein
MRGVRGLTDPSASLRAMFSFTPSQPQLFIGKAMARDSSMSLKELLSRVDASASR